MMPTPCIFRSPITRKSRSTSLSAKRRRGFVHDQDARLGAQGPRDLDQLLLGHRQRAHFGVGVDVGANAFEQPARALAAARQSDAPPSSTRLEPDGDVLGDRQVRKQRRLLVDRGDAQSARADRVELARLLAQNLDRSFVGQSGRR